MKTLLITGGNEGIGYYMAKQWLENGNNAAVIDLNCDSINKLKQAYPKTLEVLEGDVCDEEGVKAAVNEVKVKFGRIDYAVHNACLCLFKSFEEHSSEDFNRVIKVNLYGAINMTKAVVPVMTCQKQGRICFTSSGVGVTGFMNISSYSSSKGAIEALAKCMNLEYADRGVTFHIMHPPLTATRSSAPLPIPREFKTSPEKVGKGFIKNINSRKFIITPSFIDAVAIRLSYLFSLQIGRMLVKMTKKNNLK